jgi:hypothetical protein
MVPRSDGAPGLVALVDPALCVSCGICAGSCAPMGVGPPGRTGRDQLAGVREFVARAPPRRRPGGADRLRPRGGGWRVVRGGRRRAVLPVHCAGSTPHLRDRVPGAERSRRGDGGACPRATAGNREGGCSNRGRSCSGCGGLRPRRAGLRGFAPGGSCRSWRATAAVVRLVRSAPGRYALEVVWETIGAPPPAAAAQRRVALPPRIAVETGLQLEARDVALITYDADRRILEAVGRGIVRGAID